MLHTLVIGSNLAATLRFNLLTKETIGDVFPAGWGKPVWEQQVTKADDADAVRNATHTYLGRLVPLSRAIRLDEHGASIILGNGLDYPIFPAFRETTATIVQRKDELGLLPASTGRSLWRQLPAITVKRRAVDQKAGPLALSHSQAGDNVTLWIGALATDKAKIEDVVEGTYTIPAGLLTDFGRMAYENGVKHAEDAESTLIQSVKTYAAELKVVTPAYDRARQHFWTRVEQSLSALFAVAHNLTPPDQLAASDWGRAVREAARDAFEQSCPRQTPRQIQAFALGLRRLNTTPATVKAKQPKASKTKAL